MAQNWKVTFVYPAGPVPKGQVVFVTTSGAGERPSEVEIKNALRAVGIETDSPWTGIGGTYQIDYGN